MRVVLTCEVSGTRELAMNVLEVFRRVKAHIMLADEFMTLTALELLKRVDCSQPEDQVPFAVQGAGGWEGIFSECYSEQTETCKRVPECVKPMYPIQPFLSAECAWVSGCTLSGQGESRELCGPHTFLQSATARTRKPCGKICKMHEAQWYSPASSSASLSAFHRP